MTKYLKEGLNGFASVCNHRYPLINNMERKISVMKKGLSLLLALTLLFTLGMTTFSTSALADDPVTLTMFVDEPWWPYSDWSGDMCKWMTEQTGVTFDVSVAADTTELDLKVASGNLPDIIVSSDFNLLSNADLCYDWGGLIDKYNLDTTVHPAYQFVNQAADGKFYTIMVGWSADYEYKQYPDVNPEGVCATARTDILNAVLDKLGISSISSIGDMEAAMEECKVLYPDVTPYIFGSEWGNDRYMDALFGCAVNGFVDNGGKAQLWINQPQRKDMLLKLNEWFRKGYLLEENYSWTNVNTQYEWGYSGNAFILASLSNASASMDVGSKSAGADYTWTPLDQIKTDNASIWTTATGWRGMFITRDCKDPEAAIKAAMFLTNKNTAYTMLWGFEGTDWEWNADKTMAIFNYDTSDRTLANARQRYWGWLGHDGISNNMAYASVEKTRKSLAWVGSITKRNPVLGLVMNAMDTGSDEYLIYQNLIQLEKDYVVKIVCAASAEEASAKYDEMMGLVDQLGAQKVEDWANTIYPEKLAEYNEVKDIGAEGWQRN
jgi:putative aldouronate transport system substrate-binding protein